MKLNYKALSLFELLLGIILLGLLSLSIGGIEMFARNNLVSVDRRTKVQNEINFIVEHVTKEVGRAEGDVVAVPLEIVSSGPKRSFIVYQGNVSPFATRDLNDPQIYYNYTAATRTLDFLNVTGAAETLSTRVTAFNLVYAPNTDYLTLTVTLCWRPTGFYRACGDRDNPSINVQTNIKMPQVSAN